MAGETSGDDCQQGPSEISSHSEGEYNVKNIQDLLSQLLVAASKMKEPQPPVEGIQSALRRAAEDSDWYHNLCLGNWKALLGLLEVNPCLVVQTRDDGFTVLHAAARGGCKELVYYVYDKLFKETGKFVDEQSGINITWEEFVDAKYGPWEARAVDYALHSDPSTLFEFFSKGPKKFYRDFRFQQQIRSSSTPSQVKSDDVEASNHLMEIMQEESTKELFKGISKKYEERTFEFELKELQFHYAAGRIDG